MTVVDNGWAPVGAKEVEVIGQPAEQEQELDSKEQPDYLLGVGSAAWRAPMTGDEAGEATVAERDTKSRKEIGDDDENDLSS